MLDLKEVLTTAMVESSKIRTIQIEPMRIDDVEQVAALDEKCFPTPWSESAYITEVYNQSAFYVVARIGEQVVGYAGAWLIMDEAHITTLGVDPEYQGRGIGERLLASLLEEAIRRGVERSTLEVRRHNYVAQRLYRKYGFCPVAVRKGYYTNNNEDGIVMWIEDMRDPGFLQVFAKNEEALGEPA
jgi:ribosomal-protein-alanine N-acetyltransferase